MPDGGEPAGHVPEPLISEVFHSLSQPLTALSCTLELALQSDQDLEQLRGSVQTALENAEYLRQRLLLIRALNDASEDRDLATVELGAVLHELAVDASALFEAAGKKFSLTTESRPCSVRVDRVRLLRALFVFLEYLLHYLVPNGVLTIELKVGSNDQVQIRVDSMSCLPLAPAVKRSAEPYSCEIELLRRTLAAARGTIAMIQCDHERTVWLATLPVAKA